MPSHVNHDRRRGGTRPGIERPGYRPDPRAPSRTSRLGQNSAQRRALPPLGLAQRTGPDQGYGGAHASPRTTKLYDRTSDVLTLEEIEKIGI